MRVLVLGGGGREHALVQALARSPAQPLVLCAPGNGGIAEEAEVVALAPEDRDGVVSLARARAVELVVVGPEAPLVAGVADALKEVGIPCFGPSAAAAALEGSKAFAKEVMERAGVPTARWQTVENVAEGRRALRDLAGPGGVVVKADGLAAGKGVVVASSLAEAEVALEEIFVAERFGRQQRAVIEERLVGEELSLLCLCDGKTAVPLVPARDYKRAFDGDQGPNTGGMGAFSPVPGVSPGEVERLVELIHKPVVAELARRGTPFHGILYAGLMLTSEGPRVLEFNVRFGDPETQAILPRLTDDLLGLLIAATREGGLTEARPRFREEAAVTVVLASEGYPGPYRRGVPIQGLDQAKAWAQLYHAGTVRQDGTLLTAGGRVLCLTGLGMTLQEARAKAYAAAELVRFEGKRLRTDIAKEYGKEDEQR